VNQVIPPECENAKRSIRLVRLFLLKKKQKQLINLKQFWCNYY